jgi:hypothetical protein
MTINDSVEGVWEVRYCHKIPMKGLMKTTLLYRVLKHDPSNIKHEL